MVDPAARCWLLYVRMRARACEPISLCTWQMVSDTHDKLGMFGWIKLQLCNTVDILSYRQYVSRAMTGPSIEFQ